jgi:hypothetical protein
MRAFAPVGAPVQALVWPMPATVIVVPSKPRTGPELTLALVDPVEPLPLELDPVAVLLELEHEASMPTSARLATPAVPHRPNFDPMRIESP